MRKINEDCSLTDERKRKNAGLLRLIGQDKKADWVLQGKCPECGTLPKTDDFTDPLSIREYSISGLCQTCQNKVYGKDGRLDPEDKATIMSDEACMLAIAEAKPVAIMAGQWWITDEHNILMHAPIPTQLTEKMPVPTLKTEFGYPDVISKGQHQALRLVLGDVDLGQAEVVEDGRL